MKLILVESPVKARALAAMLGPDVLVRATKGHVKELPARSLGVSTEKNYRPSFRTRSSFRDELRAIRSEANLCSEILLAMDPDREGELIADDLAGLLKTVHTPIRRIRLSDLTIDSVSTAIGQPGAVDSKRASAQRTRRVIDRLIGYRTSRFLSYSLGSAKPQGAGRVQSSILVYLAETTGTPIPANDPTVRVQLSAQPSFPGSHPVSGRYISPTHTGTHRSTTERLRISGQTRRVIEIPAPAAHTTAGFLAAATRSGGTNASETMRAGQRLYEAAYRDQGFTEGLISYPRTDSFVLPPPDRIRIRDLIATLAGPGYLGKCETEGTRGAHGGLRPTDPCLLPGRLRGKLDAGAYRAYSEIWSTAIASEMAPARLELNTYSLESLHGDDRGQIEFSDVVFDGFMALAHLPDATMSATISAPPNERVPDLTVGTEVRLSGVMPDPIQPRDPDSIAECDAILELERRGYGRPGTYADALQKLVDRRYLSRRAGYLKLTPAGQRVANHLNRYLRDLVSGKMAAELENLFEEVASGKTTANAAVAAFDRQLLKPAIENAYALFAADRTARVNGARPS